MRFVLSRMSALLLCCLALAPVQAQQPEDGPTAEEQGLPNVRHTSRSLGALGYPRGVQQTHSEGSLTLQFPLPLDAPVEAARLDLHYVAALPPGAEASIQVIMNGTVRQLVPLQGGSTPLGPEAAARMVSLELTQEDLRLPTLDVRLRTTLQNLSSGCIGGMSGNGFLHVLPETALMFSISENAVASVRGYLSTLPVDVRVGVAPTAGIEAIRVAWLLAQELQLRGHAVEFSDPSGDEHVIIGPRELLSGLGAEAPPDRDMALVTDTTGTGRQRLVITEPYHVDMLATPWTGLLAGRSYQESVGAPVAEAANGTIGLETLGVDTEARHFFNSVEWLLSRDPRLLAGRQPAALRLNLIVPPGTEDNPLSLYVLQGSSVRGLSTLPPAGGTHSVEIRLGRAPTGAVEPLRVVMTRGPAAECEGPAAQGFVQLLPDSVLLTSRADRSADSIGGFARNLSGAYSVHLPAGAAAAPHGWIETLAELGRNMNLDPRLAEFGSTSMAPVESRPFFWFGDSPPEGFDAALALDRGRVQVTDGSGGVLLDSGELPGMTVVSLLRNGDRRGLWLRSLDGGVANVPPGVEGNAGDLVFGDRDSIRVSLHTRADAIPGVAYPDHVSWTDYAARYRGWIFALIWAALTITVILVTRRLRKTQ
jgi:cellulose synthase operon protein B